jgi:hypothetical protein
MSVAAAFDTYGDMVMAPATSNYSAERQQHWIKVRQPLIVKANPADRGRVNDAAPLDFLSQLLRGASVILIWPP